MKNNLIEFGLYIHWPFCIKKCPYCDFNSYAFQYEPQEWINGLKKELILAAKEFSEYKIKTIFFGGGTPSLIPPNFIKELIDLAKNLWEYKDNLEITLETNPSSIETYALEEFMSNGINRFSIGMQSLNDEKLKFLGRLHSSKEAINILTHAAKICDNVSGDFIYSLPNDTLASWKKDLNEILELANKINLKHCSLYQLTIEENTAFKQQVATKLWSPMDDDLQSILYRHTYSTLKNDWDFYEISNAARIIKKHNVSRETFQNKTEYQSQHNLVYWNYDPYLGIGAGAHSRMLDKTKTNKIKFHNIKNPYKWLEAINKNYEENNDDFFAHKLEVETLNKELEFQEKMLMGLRLSKGIKINSQEMELLNLHNLEILFEGGFLIKDESNIKATLQGRLCLNAVLKMLIK